MPQFKPLPAIVFSCFSRELYRDVYARWQGLGLNYLMLLNVVIITPTFFVLLFAIESSIFTNNNELQPEINAMIQEVVAQLPPMVFDNG